MIISIFSFTISNEIFLLHSKSLFLGHQFQFEGSKLKLKSFQQLLHTFELNTLNGVLNSDVGLLNQLINTTGLFNAHANHDNPEPNPIKNSHPSI